MKKNKNERTRPTMETTRPATAMPDDTPAALAFYMEIAERMIPAIHIKRHTVFTYGIQNRQQLTIPITRAATPIPLPELETGC